MAEHTVADDLEISFQRTELRVLWVQSNEDFEAFLTAIAESNARYEATIDTLRHDFGYGRTRSSYCW